MSGNFHESDHSLKARARLVKANGNANNQVILRGEGAGYAAVPAQSLAQMDRWLTAIEADSSNLSKTEKVVWKCTLKSIDPRDYKVTFTDAEKARLQKIFSSEACDWSKPGVGTVPLKGTWPPY